MSEKGAGEPGSEGSSSDTEKGMEMSVSSTPDTAGRPFFHPDLTTALRSVDVYLALNPSV